MAAASVPRVYDIVCGAENGPVDDAVHAGGTRVLPVWTNAGRDGQVQGLHANEPFPAQLRSARVAVQREWPLTAIIGRDSRNHSRSEPERSVRGAGSTLVGTVFCRANVGGSTVSGPAVL